MTQDQLAQMKALLAAVTTAKVKWYTEDVKESNRAAVTVAHNHLGKFVEDNAGAILDAIDDVEKLRAALKKLVEGCQNCNGTGKDWDWIFDAEEGEDIHQEVDCYRCGPARERLEESN